MSRRPKTKQTVPPMTVHEVNVADLKVTDGPSCNVYSWRDGPAHSSVPCTEVHLVLSLGQVAAVFRLKSPRALDELVGALLQHRVDVWGQGDGRPDHDPRCTIDVNGTPMAHVADCRCSLKPG